MRICVLILAYNAALTIGEAFKRIELPHSHDEIIFSTMEVMMIQVKLFKKIRMSSYINTLQTKDLVPHL